MKKVLLAYRGKLADLVALHWLKTRSKADVFTYTPLLGGAEEIAPETIGETAMRLGVESAYFGELTGKFYSHILVHAIRCSIRGRNGSFLIEALGRPVIAREMADIALENHCQHVAFSADPFSLDQLRYAQLVTSIAPSLAVVSPQTEWPMRTHQDLLKYARENGLPFDETRRKEFNVEKNVWGTRIKCGLLEDLWKDTPEEIFPEVSSVENAAGKAKYVELEFAGGVPIALNGCAMDGLDLLRELNTIGAKNSIGRRDLIAEEMLGIKTRVIQEAPGAHIICTAHKALEDITLSAEILDLQDVLTRALTRIVDEGGWFTDLRTALCDFFLKMQEHVAGTIRLKLYKGNCVVMRRKSQSALYNRELITREHKGSFPVDDLEKFINVWTMSKSAEKEQLSSKKL